MKKLIFIAFILSVITGFIGYNYLTNLEKKVAGQNMPVVVAKNQIPKHTIITAEMLDIIDLPQQAINPLSSSNTDSIIGKISKETIEPAEQILKTKISNAEEKNSGLSYTIAQGYRALTVKTDEVSGVAGEIKKGDRVDIVATMLGEVNGQKVVTSRMIVENLEVLEVGMKSTDKNAARTNTSVTLSVLAADVLKINYALSEGKYRLVLRSVVEKDIVNPPLYILTN
ncbi:MAG: Flp pilus assembly protein CpaB [Clostridia bacterium]|nr:Flp pilus assembly protein CpaB [Clostridia bacterium]